MLGALLDFGQIGLITRVIDSPAAGVDFRWDSPEDTRILVISISFLLTSDANIDNRRATVRAYQGPVQIAEAPAPGLQVASESLTYHFAPCVLGIDDSTDNPVMWAPISPNMVLDRDHSLASNIYAIQAGDQISNIVIRYYQSMPR